MSSNIEQYNARRKAQMAARGAAEMARKAAGGGRRSASAPKGKTPPVLNTRASHSVPSRPDPKVEIAKIKQALAKYSKIMSEEHSYIVYHSLNRAKCMIDDREKEETQERQESLKDKWMDKTSPFKNMRGIELTGSAATAAACTASVKDLRLGKFVMRHYPNKISNPLPEVKYFVRGHIALSPSAKGIPALPKYHSYTTLKSNILAEDDEIMRYFPYFGEEAAEEDVLDMLNLEEAFVDRTKNAQEENMRAEKGILFVDYVHRFLSDLNIDLNAISQYLIGDLSKTGWPAARKKNREKFLPEDFDLSEASLQNAIKKLVPVSINELERAETVCTVFFDVMDFSLWEVAKRGEECVRVSMGPTRNSGGGQGNASAIPGGKNAADAVAALTGGNPQPYCLESYAALNCLYCYMHECPFHVNTTKDAAFLNSNGLKLPTNPTTSGSRKHAFSEGAECSKGCFISATEEDRSKKTVWTQAQTQLLFASAAVLRDNPRVSCLLACIINKYCYEIEGELHRQGLLTAEVEMPIMIAHSESPEPQGPNQKGVTGKRKRTFRLNEYPADCYKTSHADKRSYFKPCMHTGPCTSECPCVEDKVMCEKSCSCDSDCPRRWRGCNCAASGKACSQTANCPCVKWNRECDPDLCHSCGSAETLSPSNRYDEELAKECCQNVALQRDLPRRTLLGVSGVSGMGLFIGENVKKDDFLGEYKGEIVSNEEAERRGKLYDKRGVSFLFNLNETQVIDATRAGNKFRFVNHYKKPNCYAKVLFANCTHRIGMFAKRDLVSGEELYFDYGYNNKSVQFIAQEPDYIYNPTAEKEREKGPPRKRNTGNRGNWNTGVTARTLKQKQLKEMEKQHSGSASGGSVTPNGALSTSGATPVTTTLPIVGRSRGRSVASQLASALSRAARGATSPIAAGASGRLAPGVGGQKGKRASGTGTPSSIGSENHTPVPDADDHHHASSRSRLRNRVLGSDEEEDDTDDDPVTDRKRRRSPRRAESSKEVSGGEEEEEEEEERSGESEEGEEDEDDEEEDETGLNGRLWSRLGRMLRGRASEANTSDDDEDEDEEDEYAPTREVRRHRRREQRAAAAGTTTGMAVLGTKRRRIL